MKNRIGKCTLALGILFVLTSMMKSSQAEIEFKPISLAEAQKMANSSGKLIFIDCYTVWCGPCKWMTTNTFTNDEVAKLYNDNFINLKVEMEKDPDGAELAAKYEVKAYPTLLFINGKGDLIRKEIGAKDANALITMAKAVMNK